MTNIRPRRAIGPPAPARWRGAVPSLRRIPVVDAALAALLTVSTLLVHDLRYLLTLPFWTDEAWVAISTKLPLHQLIRVTGSTPVGWSLLLRLAVFGGEQGLRLVPLAFAALTVAAAYLWARTLPWPTVHIARIAAVLAGVAALLVPSALARDDLKQYTADAFVTVVVLYATSRVEAVRSRGRLAGLGVLVVVAFFFSAVAAFIGAAVFGGLLLIAVRQARWPGAGDVAAAGAATGALLALVYLVLYRPGTPPGLNAYWSAFYVPVDQGWGASWTFLWVRFHSLAGYLGLPPLVAVLLISGGVATAVLLGRPAVALAIPLLVAEMVLLGAAGQYPLLDLRTSHFLTTALAVTAAIGVAGGCLLLRRWHPAAPVVAALVAGALFLFDVRDGIRAAAINKPSTIVEDVRTPTAYLAGHLRPGDVVVVNMLSSWGVAYYWPGGRPAIEPVTANLQQFVAVLADQPGVLVATDRTKGAVDAVMARALTAATTPGARIYLLHQHTLRPELQAYFAAAAAAGLKRTQVVPDSLELLTRP